MYPVVTSHRSLKCISESSELFSFWCVVSKNGQFSGYYSNMAYIQFQNLHCTVSHIFPSSSNFYVKIEAVQHFYLIFDECTYSFQPYLIQYISLISRISYTFCKGHLGLFACRADQAHDLLLTDILFKHQVQPATSQHGQIPQTVHFTMAAQTAGIYSWWVRSVGARRLMYVESHSHALSRGKFRGITQSGLSQSQYCLARGGGWGRRSVAPCTTQLKKDRLWRDWLTAYQISQKSSGKGLDKTAATKDWKSCERLKHLGKHLTIN